MGKKIPKLPEGWHWSYVIGPFRECDGKMHRWSACAVRYLGKHKLGTRMEYSMSKSGTPVIVELGLYNEVFSRGKTMTEATAKVIEIINTRKHFKRRWIHFPDEN